MKMQEMDTIFKKLNYKEPATIICVNAPRSFEGNLNEMAGYTNVVRSLEDATEITFALIFVTRKVEIVPAMEELDTKVKGDVVLWFAYPKASSKKYRCDFNRDTGWTGLGAFEVEPVRQVAIDEDWSALRFRKVQFIKKLTRSKRMTLSNEGKRRASGK